MNSNQKPDFVFLGEVIALWRRRTGVSQNQVAARGGPSDTTLSAIESGEWRSNRPAATLAKIDAGLEWPGGMAERVAYEHFDPNEHVVEFRDIAAKELPDELDEAEEQVAYLRETVFLTEASMHELQAGLARTRAQLIRAEANLARLRNVRVAAMGGEGTLVAGPSSNDSERRFQEYLDEQAEIKAEDARQRALDDHDQELRAARDIGRPSRGQARRAAADSAGEPETDDDADMEPR